MLRPYQILACVLVALSATARAELVPPSWQALVFEKRNLLGVARAEIGIRTPGRCAEAGWRLVVDNSLPGMRETIDLTLACDSGETVERERVSRGREQRTKAWHYAAPLVLRERREPPEVRGEVVLPPEQWPISSSVRIEMPAPARSQTVTSPHGLLALLDTFIDDPSMQQLVVHTDLNFYRLEVSRTLDDLELGDALPWGERLLRGNRSVHRLTLRAIPMEGNPDRDDFTFLGLTGEIVIDVDTRTRLPLRIRGTAPRLGNTALRLVAASPAESRGIAYRALAQGRNGL